MPSIPDPKQELFSRFVAEGKTRKEAAISAGYSAKSAASIGSRLSKKFNISQRIQEVQQISASLSITKAVLSKDWIVEKLKENVERAMQLIPVLNSTGQQTGEFRYEGNVANKALELLGKHIGFFEPLLKEDGSGPNQKVIIKMPNGEEIDAKPLNADALKAAGKGFPIE